MKNLLLCILLPLMACLSAPAQTSTSIVIVPEAPLPDALGLNYPLKGNLAQVPATALAAPASGASSGNSANAQEETHNDAKEEAFDPVPTQFNVRIADNRLHVIFLNKENLVTRPPATVERISLQYEAINGDSQREQFTLNPVGNLYYKGSRFMRPPHYYRIKLVFTIKAPDSSESQTEAYGFDILNQHAQPKTKTPAIGNNLDPEIDLQPGYDNYSDNQPIDPAPVDSEEPESTERYGM